MSIQRICSSFCSYVLLSLFSIVYCAFVNVFHLPQSWIISRQISNLFEMFEDMMANWKILLTMHLFKIGYAISKIPIPIAYNRYWIFSRIFISASLALLYRTDFLSTFSAYPFGGAEHYSRSCFIVVVAVNVRHHESSLSQLNSLDS